MGPPVEPATVILLHECFERDVTLRFIFLLDYR